MNVAYLDSSAIVKLFDKALNQAARLLGLRLPDFVPLG